MKVNKQIANIYPSQFIDFLSKYVEDDNEAINSIFKKDNTEYFFYTGAAKIFNKQIKFNLSKAKDQDQKEEIAHHHVSCFFDLLEKFKIGEGKYKLSNFPANTPLLTFFINYINIEMKKYWCDVYYDTDNMVYVGFEEEKEDEQGNYHTTPFEKNAYQQWEQAGQGKQNTNNVTSLLENPDIMQEFTDTLEPLQLEIFKELLHIAENNYEAIEQKKYKKMICKKLKMYYKGKEYYQKLNNELEYIRNNFIKFCKKHNADITSYLMKNKEEVNLKKSNYIKVKELCEYIEGKSLASCADKILDFYGQQKKIENKNNGIYSYQEHHVYDELLELIEFSYLKQIHISVENREYFYGVHKQEQYLILNQLHSALIQFEKIYKKYDDIEKINYEIA